MAEFPPKAQRDQILFIVIVLALGAIGGFYQWAWAPQHETLNALAARVDTLTARNDSSRKDMATGNLSKLQAEAERLRNNLDVMRQLVPTGNEVPELLEQVSGAARRAGLELSDVQPEPVIRGEAFDAYRYRMAVLGDYHSIGSFLTNVGSLTRIITPINLQLSPASPTAANRSRLRPGQQLLEARFQIQTYVAKTRAAAGARATADSTRTP